MKRTEKYWEESCSQKPVCLTSTHPILVDLVDNVVDLVPHEDLLQHVDLVPCVDLVPHEDLVPHVNLIHTENRNYGSLMEFISNKMFRLYLLTILMIHLD